MMISLLLYSLLLVIPTSAKIHELNWRLSYKQVNPDNSSTPCQIISINDQFPPPIIRLKQHDTLRINLYNGLDEPTALHFHGIFQKGFNQMDGPTMLTQCPILPQTHFTYEFTVNQTGTYWYHAHESVQYGDGLRGALIIEEDEQKYDHDVVVTLSDWYYGKSEQLLHDSKGNEPRIDSSLFNDTRDVKWGVEPNEEILIRLINMGMSGSQYFYIEDHNLTIVEVDGVKIQPVEVDSVLLATGQRYGVVLQTKSNRDRNYGMVSITNMMMRKVYLDNWIVYDFAKPLDPPLEIHPRDLNYIDDFQLKPLVTTPRLGTPNHQFEFTYDSIDYQGQNYWTMNGVPHLSPKIPTLMTVLSSGDDEFGNPSIYGNSTNTIIIEKGDIVDIIVNSNDMMKHPFHLHGHNFQVLARERKKHYEHDSSKFPDFPLVRDTIVVPNHGYVVLRFIADNPGVWFFHCHTDWHAATGLGVVFIESPDLIRRDLKLNKESLEMCLKGGVKTRGNAAGNDDFMDLKGDVSIYNINEKESTSIPTTTSSSLPSPSSTDSMMKSSSSFHTKVVVLIIYFTIMLMIAIAGAFFINKRIRSNIHYKKGKYRRLSTIANVEPEQGIEL